MFPFFLDSSTQAKDNDGGTGGTIAHNPSPSTPNQYFNDAAHDDAAHDDNDGVVSLSSASFFQEGDDYEESEEEENEELHANLKRDGCFCVQGLRLGVFTPQAISPEMIGNFSVFPVRSS